MDSSPLESIYLGVEDLVAQAEARVAGAGIRAANGQVAEALTVRNARYYATLGLLAPAAARRGRNALYTEAHVDQLVAVKRLQGDGLHLAEIQRALVGLSPDRVRAIADGDAEPAERFWATRPVADAPLGAPLDPAPAAGPTSTEARSVVADAAVAPPHAGQDLAPSAAPAPPVPSAASLPAALVIDLGDGVGLQVPPGLTLAPPAVDRVLDNARSVLTGTTGHSTAPLIFPKLATPYGQEHRP